MHELKIDYLYYCELIGRKPHFLWLLDAIRNHSIMAAYWFKRSAKSRGWGRIITRTILLTFFSSDVAYGTKFEGAIFVPHPLGIVIGAGAEIGDKVRIYQNVTVGTDGTGRYPRIGEESILFAGCTVIGGGVIGPGERIRAGEIRVLKD